MDEFLPEGIAVGVETLAQMSPMSRAKSQQVPWRELPPSHWPPQETTYRDVTACRLTDLRAWTAAQAPGSTRKSPPSGLSGSLWFDSDIVSLSPLLTPSFRHNTQQAQEAAAALVQPREVVSS